MSPAATVLIVDDHPVVRPASRRCWGWRTGWPGSSRLDRRIGAAAGATERVDVAVVDRGLPDGDGVELVRRPAPGPGLPGARADDDPRRGHRPGASRRGRGRLPAQGLAAAQPSAPSARCSTAGWCWARGRARCAPHHPAGPAPRPTGPPDPGRSAPARPRRRRPDEPRIAAELGVAEKTVRNRVSALLGVLGVEDRVQAALLAREKGLTKGVTLPVDRAPCDRRGPACARPEVHSGRHRARRPLHRARRPRHAARPLPSSRSPSTTICRTSHSPRRVLRHSRTKRGPSAVDPLTWEFFAADGTVLSQVTDQSTAKVTLEPDPEATPPTDLDRQTPSTASTRSWPGCRCSSTATCRPGWWPSTGASRACRASCPTLSRDSAAVLQVPVTITQTTRATGCTTSATGSGGADRVTSDALAGPDAPVGR